MKNIVALIAGLIFGLGLTISQMINPAKVLAFLDIFSGWDPSLMFVMGSALAVTFVGYRFVLGWGKPVLADRFQLPSATEIDRRLIVGSLLFGFGWGLVGLCPGPAIAALTLGGQSIYVYLASMLGGMAVYEAWQRMRLRMSSAQA